MSNVSIVEILMVVVGIGQGRITNNLGTLIKEIDGSFTIGDEKSISMLYDLLHTEGLYLGASSALNVVAAVELAQKLGPGKSYHSNYKVCFQFIKHLVITGHTIATILCDGAYRYQSRLFSKKWLGAKGLQSAIPDHLQKYAVLD